MEQGRRPPARLPDLKLTIALTRQMSTPLAKATLEPWAAAGRVEIAARIHGDPVLPLIGRTPRRARARTTRSSAPPRPGRRRGTLGAPAAGFVPGDGALDPSLVGPSPRGRRVGARRPLRRRGRLWAARGEAVFVPARAAPRGRAPAPEDFSAPGVGVVDEPRHPKRASWPRSRDLPGARPPAAGRRSPSWSSSRRAARSTPEASRLARLGRRAAAAPGSVRARRSTPTAKPRRRSPATRTPAPPT